MQVSVERWRKVEAEDAHYEPRVRVGAEVQAAAAEKMGRDEDPLRPLPEVLQIAVSVLLGQPIVEHRSFLGPSLHLRHQALADLIAF